MNWAIVTAAIALIGLIISIVGWGYNLGYQSARINRNEKDIENIDEKISSGLNRIYDKIDDLPCRDFSGVKDRGCSIK